MKIAVWIVGLLIFGGLAGLIAELLNWKAWTATVLGALAGLGWYLFLALVVWPGWKVFN